MRLPSAWLRAGLVGLAACDAGGAGFYPAQKFDPTRCCVEKPVVIDIIPGGQTSNGCAPECLATTDDSGSPLGCVSSQCGP